MRYIAIVLMGLFLSIFSVSADVTVEEQIDIKQGEIQKYTDLLDERTFLYQEESALLERKFNIEKQRELNDCASRGVTCTSSSAEKKYEPLFAEINSQYTSDIAPWQESIATLSQEIKDIRQAELDKKQAELDAIAQEGIISPISTELFSNSVNDEISSIRQQIVAYEVQKQSVITQYDADVARTTADYEKQKQSELDDCARRDIQNCIGLFADRKYGPIFETLEREYWGELFIWTEKIRLAEQNIKDIIAEEERKKQEIIDSRTDEEVRQDQVVLLSIEQSELDFQKAEGYFENKSYNNALIFYEKSCANQYSQLFLCYRGIANTYEKLYKFTEASEYFEKAKNHSYTDEDTVAIQTKVQQMNAKASQLVSLNVALDKFIKGVDAKFEGKELIGKLNFYDSAVIVITKKQKKITNPDTLILVDIILQSLRRAQQQVEKEINDIYG